MRILFMGTPDIAAESLAALIEAGHEICAVFTRRDKPVGRKPVPYTHLDVYKRQSMCWKWPHRPARPL